MTRGDQNQETKRRKFNESRIVTPISSDDSEDDDSAFYDALETMQEKMMYQSIRIPLESMSHEESKSSTRVDDDEPLERDVLPWLKDPNAKISIWAILKDNIGKDISRISVPVVFNDPTSLLQKCAQSMEYNELLDRAGTEPNPARRIAIVAVHAISQLTIAERTASKPFNPLLGETYEYVTKDFSYLSEQVSHHPPITANYCRSNKGLYTLFTNQKTNTKFNGKYLALTQQYRVYVDLD